MLEINFYQWLKQLLQVNTVKNNFDTLRNEGQACTAGGIPPAQIKPNMFIQMFTIKIHFLKENNFLFTMYIM